MRKCPALVLQSNNSVSTTRTNRLVLYGNEWRHVRNSHITFNDVHVQVYGALSLFIMTITQNTYTHCGTNCKDVNCYNS